MSGATLFMIEAEYRALEETIDEHEGDITACEAVICHWLQELGGARDAKLNGYATLIREVEARAVARKGRAREMLALAAADEAKVERLKGALKWFFEAQGLKTVDTGDHKISLVGNGGQTPVKVEAVVDDLPLDCVRVVTSPDVDAIRARLLAGAAIPGCTLMPRGNHLRLK